MSQFTKKDFALIADCIAEALDNVVKDGTIERYGINASITRKTFLKISSEAFEKRLKYTNDNFDGNRFRAEVENILINKGFFQVIP